MLLYEFIAEVAGVRPAEPGVTFQPRIELYRALRVRVPLRRKGDKVNLLAHVSWEPISEGTTEVRMTIEGPISEVIPVAVKLPSCPTRLIESTMIIEFVVQTEIWLVLNMAYIYE